MGDRQPGATRTYTFTSPKFYNANSKLVASGLLGPVRIIERIPRGCPLDSAGSAEPCPKIF